MSSVAGYLTLPEAAAHTRRRTSPTGGLKAALQAPSSPVATRKNPNHPRSRISTAFWLTCYPSFTCRSSMFDEDRI